MKASIERRDAGAQAASDGREAVSRNVARKQLAMRATGNERQRKDAFIHS
jgi:hypothetical protein